MTTRFTLSELGQAVARGKFDTSDTVTITLYRNASATPETLDSNSCTELGSTGHFIWLFSEITTAPTTYSDYLAIMSNGTPAENQYDNYLFGGYPDDISHLSGANTVTITVETALSVAIAGAKVTIYNSDNTLLLDSKDTDSSGQAVFYLDDASYKVRLQKSQVTFTAAEDLTVSGTTTDTYNGTPLSIVAQSGADECEVSMFVSSQRPTIALSKLEGTAQITVLPTVLGGVYYSGQKIDGTYDAANKRIYWILPQESVVEFNVTDILSTTKVSKSIPAIVSANFQDLDDR